MYLLSYLGKNSKISKTKVPNLATDIGMKMSQSEARADKEFVCLFFTMFAWFYNARLADSDVFLKGLSIIGYHKGVYIY